MAKSKAPEVKMTRKGRPALAGDERRGRNVLELDIKRVTDQFTKGKLAKKYLADGEKLTPHKVANIIKEQDRLEEAPSTGAVAACFDRWAAVKFAEFSSKPVSFLGYVGDGTQKELDERKATASAAKRAARQNAKPAANKAPVTKKAPANKTPAAKKAPAAKKVSASARKESMKAGIDKRAAARRAS